MAVKPGYKQTDVGVIPENWVVKELSEIVTYVNGKSYERYISEMGDYFLITLDSLDINGKLKEDHKKVALWELRGLTANMGSRNEVSIPV